MKKSSFNIVMLIIFIIPIACSLISSIVASMLKCQLNEGDVQVCMVFGNNIGGMLYALFCAYWLSLLFVPVALAVYAIRGIVLFFKKRPKD